MKKNLILLVVVLVLSYFTAPWFGSIYNLLAPGELDGAWIGSQSSWEFIIGLPFAYIFFTTLLIQAFGSGNKKKWIGWLLAPALLFFLSGDTAHIYLPIVLAIVAFGLAKLITLAIPKKKIIV